MPANRLSLVFLYRDSKHGAQQNALVNYAMLANLAEPALEPQPAALGPRPNFFGA